MNSCCQKPDRLIGGSSPFTKMIALGFYDGPTSGLMQCESCKTAYRFDMLDWDEDHAVRIFRLWPLPANAWTKCLLALASESPKWPVWVPSKSNQEVSAIFDQAKAAELILAWDRDDDRILAAKKVSSSKLNTAPSWFDLDSSAATEDWFAFLGLVRESASR